MTKGTCDFQVSLEELDYLNGLSAQDEFLARLLNPKREAHGRNATISLSGVEAEELRSFLTNHLAAVGFDKNYALNEEGRMLEKLIDRFYLC